MSSSEYKDKVPCSSMPTERLRTSGIKPRGGEAPLSHTHVLVEETDRLTGGVSRHLDDTLAVLADLPGVEGPDAHRHFHRGCHGSSSRLAPTGALRSRLAQEGRDLLTADL